MSALKLNTIVRVPQDRQGILRYIGPVSDKPGTFAGIELINGAEGRNNGDFKGVQYFEVSVPNSGIFYLYESILGLNRKTAPSTQKQIRRAFSTAHAEPNRRVSFRRPTASFAPAAPSIDTVAETKKTDTTQHEKSQLMSELARVRSELGDVQALLAEAQHQLRLKDSKLVKTKQQADEQKNELREAIAALEEQALENAELYTQKVESLQKQIAKLKLKLTELGQLGGSVSAEQSFTSVGGLSKELLAIEEQLELAKLECQELSEVVQEKDHVIKELKKEAIELKKQLETKERELQRLLKSKDEDTKKLTTQAERFSQQLNEKEVLIESLRAKIQALESVSGETSVSSVESEKESKFVAPESNFVAPELPIYKPSVALDPSAGREKWCGLCEREGHDSYECPFEE